MTLGVNRHAVVPSAAGDAIAVDDCVGGGIDLGQRIAVLKVDVHLARHGIILRDAGFTVEPQHLDGGVCPDVDDAFRFRALVGDVRLVEGRGVGDPVRLVFRWKSLDDTHTRQIDYANLVFSPVRGIDLPAFGDVSNAFDARYVTDGLDDRIRPQVDYVQEAGAEMSGEQVVVVLVDL